MAQRRGFEVFPSATKVKLDLRHLYRCCGVKLLTTMVTLDGNEWEVVAERRKMGPGEGLTHSKVFTCLICFFTFL